MLLGERNDFDARSYGAAHLGELLNSSRCSVLGGKARSPEFEVRRLKTGTVVRIVPVGALSTEPLPELSPEAIKELRKDERERLIALEAASSPALDALRTFFNSYEGLKGAYAARGATSDQRLAVADSKVREVLGLLQPAGEHAEAAQAPAARRRWILGRVRSLLQLLMRSVRRLPQRLLRGERAICASAATA
eukprot:1279052-Prymnesium_polylepis.1